MVIFSHALSRASDGSLAYSFVPQAPVHYPQLPELPPCYTSPFRIDEDDFLTHTFIVRPDAQAENRNRNGVIASNPGVSNCATKTRTTAQIPLTPRLGLVSNVTREASNVGRRRANAVSLADSPARKGHSSEMARLFHKAQRTLLFQNSLPDAAPSTARKPLLSMPKRKCRQRLQLEDTGITSGRCIVKSPAENGNLSVAAVDKDQPWRAQTEGDMLKSEPFPIPGISWQAITISKQQVLSEQSNAAQPQSTMISMQQLSEVKGDSGVDMSPPIVSVQEMYDLHEEDVGYWTGDEDYYIQQQRDAAAEHNKLVDSVARWLDDISLNPLFPGGAASAEDEDFNDCPLYPPDATRWRATAASIQQTPRRFKIPARKSVTPLQRSTRFLSSKLPTTYLIRTGTPTGRETHLSSGNGFQELHSAFSSSQSSSLLEDTAKDPRRAAEVFCRREDVPEHEESTPGRALVQNDLIPLSPSVQTYRRGKRSSNRRQFSTVSDEILGLNDQERRKLGLWTGLCGVAVSRED